MNEQSALSPSNDPSGEIISIDGEKYVRVKEGIDGRKGREGNRISEGIRDRDGKRVVLKFVPEDVSRGTLAELNTAITIRQRLGKTLNPKRIPEFLCGPREPGEWGVTNFIEGYTLEEKRRITKIIKGLRPPSARIKTVTHDLLGILRTALEWEQRERGLIHRDIKPENIVIRCPKFGLKPKKSAIIDWEFGTTEERLRTEKPESEKKVYEYILGTPQYMAPEVAAGMGWWTESDTFAMGIIAAEGLGIEVSNPNSKPEKIMIEKICGTYRDRIFEGLIKFNNEINEEVREKENPPFNHGLWRNLRIWMLRATLPDPKKRPSRRESISILENHF